MIDYKDFNYQINGLWTDVLSQYGIEVPKMNGQNSVNHPCPLCGGHDRAHWRDVDGRLALYCRNCASDTMHSVENVIMQYANINFSQLVKDLANFINHVPIETLKKAQKRIDKKPKFEDMQKNTEEFLLSCQLEKKSGIDFYRYEKGFCLPLLNWFGDIESAVKFEDNKKMEFINKNIGASFTPVKIKESDNWLVVESMASARFITHNYNINVAIAWSDWNIERIIKSAPTWIKCIPVYEGCHRPHHIEKYCLFNNYKLRRFGG